MGIIFLHYPGMWEDEARAQEDPMNGKDYALGHGRRGMEASIPPSKLTKEVEGGAGDHPGQQAAHIQDKSRGVGTWPSHPSCLEHWDTDIVLGCTLHSQCSCSWSPLQELGINLLPRTIHSSQPRHTWPSQPIIPPESEGLSQTDPTIPTLAKNLPQFLINHSLHQ